MIQRLSSVSSIGKVIFLQSSACILLSNTYLVKCKGKQENSAWKVRRVVISRVEEKRWSSIWGNYKDSYNTNNYLLNLGVGI